MLIIDPFVHLGIAFFWIFIRSLKGKKTLLPSLTALLYLLFLVSPLPGILVMQSESFLKKFEAADNLSATGIVLSGGTVMKKDTHFIFLPQSSRIFEALLSYQEGSIQKIIIAGHDEREGLQSEAESMKDLAVRLGVKKEDILLENQSRTTAEHAKNLKKILDPKTLGPLIIFTSQSHRLRSILTFRKAGFEAYVPKDRDQVLISWGGHNLENFEDFLYEILGLASYKLRGLI